MQVALLVLLAVHGRAVRMPADDMLANLTASSELAAKQTVGKEGPHTHRGIVDFMFEKLRRPFGGAVSDHLAMGTTAKLMKIKRNGPQDLHSLLSACATSFLVILFCLVLLIVLQRALPGVYGERSGGQRKALLSEAGLPAACDGPVSQALAAAQLGQKQMVEAAGLDALMIREFHALCRKIFAFLILGTLPVLGPLHFLASRGGSADYLSCLDVGAVLGLADLKTVGSTDSRGLLELTLPCWAHVLAVWLTVLMILRQIMVAQRNFLQRRFEWLQSVQPPRATTLMVEGIPAPLRSDENLKEYYARLFSSEAIERAYVVRRTRKLRALVGEVRKLERRLAVARASAEAGGITSRLHAWLAVLARWVLLPAAGGEPEALEKQLAEAREAAREERESVEAAVQQLDPAVCSASGFVTFTTRRWCRLASREQLRADAGALRMSMPPDPEDVRFEDLAEHATRGAAREWLATFLKFCVVCSWMPFVVTVACVADLATLRRKVPYLDALITQWPALLPVLQGILASLLLQMLMGQLPTVMMAIITNFQTLKSGAWAQLELQRTYLLLQIVFVLLVTAINQTVLASLQILLKEPQLVFVLLADNLPSSSHFYLNYMAVGCAGLACSVLRSGMVLHYVGFRLSGSKPEEARERAEVEDAKQVNGGTGVRMSRASFMATVGLVFCLCTPLIAVLAWVYFAIGEHVFPYLLVYGENKRPDLGGAFWFAALEGLLGALGLFVLLEVGILGRAGDPLAAAAAAAAVCALLVGHARLQSLRGEVLPFETIVDVECGPGLSEPEKTTAPSRPSASAAVYQQPECGGDEAL